jgi:hypothetical protein
MNDPKEKPVFAPAEAKEQLQLRALHNHLVRIVLESQHFNKWDDATTFALLACYQADTIDKLSSEVLALRNLQPVRYMGTDTGSGDSGASFKQWDGLNVPESQPAPKSLNLNDPVAKGGSDGKG